MRIRNFLLVLMVLGLASACITRSDTNPGEGWVGQMVAYHKAVSPEHGTVGFVKVYSYEKEGFGEPFTLYHVYDLDFVERGILNTMGTGKKFVVLATDVAEVRGVETEEIDLEAQPIPYNVARCLDLDISTTLTLVPASREDLVSPK